MSCLPTGASGAAVEMNTGDGDGEGAGAARPCPVLPGEPTHPAAAPAITTLSQAHKIRPAAFPRAGCHALPCGKLPAGATRRRRPRSQDQFISSRPLHETEKQRSCHTHPARSRQTYGWHPGSARAEGRPPTSQQSPILRQHVPVERHAADRASGNGELIRRCRGTRQGFCELRRGHRKWGPKRLGVRDGPPGHGDPVHGVPGAGPQPADRAAVAAPQGGRTTCGGSGRCRCSCGSWT